MPATRLRKRLSYRFRPVTLPVVHGGGTVPSGYLSAWTGLALIGFCGHLGMAGPRPRVRHGERRGAAVL